MSYTSRASPSLGRGIDSARRAERLRPVHAHLALRIDRERDAHFAKRRVRQVGAVRRRETAGMARAISSR